MKYLQQNLNIKIYIDKDDIDSTDIVKIYETTGDTTLIATLASKETTDDPVETGDAYLYEYTKLVTTNNIYKFYYTISDSYGNESASISTFQKAVCLTPRTPSAPHSPVFDAPNLTLTIATDINGSETDTYSLRHYTDSNPTSIFDTGSIDDGDTSVTVEIYEYTQLIQNNTFDTSDYWITSGTGWVISSGYATYAENGSVDKLEQTGISVISGHRYSVSFDMHGLNNTVSMDVVPSLGTVMGTVKNSPNGVTTSHAQIITANTTGAVSFEIDCYGLPSEIMGWIDNVYIVDIDEDIDDTYYYTLTAENHCNEVDSATSGECEFTIANGELYSPPLSDPENLSLQTIADGQFYLYFNYNTTSDDDITKFNVYVDNDGDPSANNWSLDGSLTYYYASGNKFRYTTHAQTDGTFCFFKVVPTTVVGLNEYERDNEVTVSGTADDQAPIVTTDHIDIELE